MFFFYHFPDILTEFIIDLVGSHILGILEK